MPSNPIDPFRTLFRLYQLRRRVLFRIGLVITASLGWLLAFCVHRSETFQKAFELWKSSTILQHFLDPEEMLIEKLAEVSLLFVGFMAFAFYAYDRSKDDPKALERLNSVVPYLSFAYGALAGFAFAIACFMGGFAAYLTLHTSQHKLLALASFTSLVMLAFGWFIKLGFPVQLERNALMDRWSKGAAQFFGFLWVVTLLFVLFYDIASHMMFIRRHIGSAA